MAESTLVVAPQRQIDAGENLHFAEAPIVPGLKTTRIGTLRRAAPFQLPLFVTSAHPIIRNLNIEDIEQKPFEENRLATVAYNLDFIDP